MTEVGAAADLTVPPSRSRAFVGAAAVVSAMTWATLVLAGRMAGPSGYVTFSALWGLFYSVAGALYGYQQEVTRTVATPLLELAPRATARHPWPVGMVAGAVGVVAACAVALLTILVGASSPSAPTSVVVVMTVGALIQVGYSTVNGVLAGTGSWRTLAGVILAEALVKLVLTGLVLDASTAPGTVALVVLSGTMVWPAALVARRTRHRIAAALRRPMARAHANVPLAVLIAGCSALLLAGFPFLLASTAIRHHLQAPGVVAAAVTFGRGPLLVLAPPLAVVLMQRIASTTEVVRLSRLHVGVIAISAAGVVLSGWAIGPSVLRLLLGSAYSIERTFAAEIILSAFLLLGQVLTGTILMGLSMHGRAALGWGISTVCTLGALQAPLAPGAALASALLVAPAVGLLVHCQALRSSMRGAHSMVQTRQPDQRRA